MMDFYLCVFYILYKQGKASLSAMFKLIRTKLFMSFANFGFIWERVEEFHVLPCHDKNFSQMWLQNMTLSLGSQASFHAFIVVRRHFFKYCTYRKKSGVCKSSIE